MAVCSCPYEYNEDKMQLRFNCMGSLYGSSVEDFPECFGRVIDAILENKKVQSVVLAREREYEYDYPQVKMLVEIADIIDFAMRERLIDYSRMGSEECRRCYPDWSKELQRIVFDLLRRDPVGAYVEVLREARTVSAKMKRAASRACYNCLRAYNRDVLGVLRERLEATELIKRAKPRVYGYHVGERSPYRQIFMPSTRPNFMFTRYMITPPEGGHSVDRYKVEDSQIEIYKLPDVAQYLYYILPPEFRLSEERYAVLDAARRYMAAHRPTTAEFVKSERVRDIFFNIGRDTIRETADKMGISLGAKDVKQLADILTRYTAGFGVLELLLADEKIQDMYINSPIESQPILVYHQDWGECKTNLIPTREDAEAWATRLRILSGRPLDEANPVLDVDIAVPGGKARFAVITRTLSPEGLGFAVRRHRYKPWTLPLFIKNKMINPLTAGLLSFLIDGNAAMIVAGGRSAGKTSLLAALMLEILPKVRIVTIEDSVTGDAEIVFEKNGKVRRGAVGELIDGLIEKHGKRFAGREVVDMNPEDIKVFSINSLGKVELAPVSKFIRHKVRKDIHMVKTRTGKTIKVTGDHSLFTLGEYGEVKPIEVRKLKKGDYIVTPRCLPLGSRKRGLLDVLKDLQIKNAYLIGSGIGKAIGLDRESVLKAARSCGYSKVTVGWWKRRNLVPLKVFRKMGKHFKCNATHIKFSKNSKPIPTKIGLDSDFLTFVGLWLADGCYDKNSVIISIAEEEGREIVRRVGEKFGLKAKMHSDGFSLMLHSTTLKQLMQLMGLVGNSFTKRVPGWVFGLSPFQINAVLRGVFSGDGCVSDKEIMLSLRSRKLAKDVQTLLLASGIIFRYNERGGFCNGRISALKSIKAFSEKIGTLQDKKTERLEKLCARVSVHDSTDIIPLPVSAKEMLACVCEGFNVHDYVTRGFNIGRGKLGNLLEYVGTDDTFADNLNNLAFSDILWDEVKEIKKCKQKEVFVYDFSVPGNENFICENILAHNTLELPVEQLRELKYNIESLKSRSVITRVETEMPADEALRTSLRLGDSAMIVGEIRSLEAKALWEAMRIGALSNVVAGTIHGESPYGVFDRVVNDLQVPATSFKATDIIVICKMLRSADGLRRFRRVTDVTEVRKKWEHDPVREGGFMDLMAYSGKEDTLKPSDTLLNGESHILNRIASYVREWAGNWDRVWGNILLRSKIKEAMVDASEKFKRPELIEAGWVVESNNIYHLLAEKIRQEVGFADPDRIYAEWLKWFKGRMKKE